MAGYAFSRKEDIDALLGLVRRQENKSRIAVEPPERTVHNALLLTPSSGIPAKSGNVSGQAECTLLYINVQTGEILEALDKNGNVQDVTVFNPFSSPIGGDRTITAKYSLGALIVDAEDCQ